MQRRIPPTPQKRRVPPPPGAKKVVPPTQAVQVEAPAVKAPPVRKAPTRNIPTKRTSEVPVVEAPKTTPPIAPVQQEPTPPPMQQPTNEIERITYKEMRELTTEDRIKLSKELNKGNTKHLIPLIKRSELPKHMVFRKEEARLRELIGPPRVQKPKMYYCPYCVDFMKFQMDSYSGYVRCIGCGISTKDYYTRADNQLFDAD